MDLENSCRICFNKLKDKRHGINSKIKNMIIKFVPTMDIYLSNEHSLCNSCYTSLNKTNMFILTIKKAEERLKNSSKQDLIMDLKNEYDDEQFVTDHDKLITIETINGEIKHDNTNMYIIENEYYEEQKFNPEYVIIENEHNVEVITETENSIVDSQKQAEEILDIRNKLLLLKMSKLECPTCHEIVNILESQTHMENCAITHLSLQKLVPCVDCDMLISKTRLPQHCEKFHVVIQCQNCKGIFESKQDLNKHSSQCKKVYKCQECKIRFKTALECLEHHNEKHQIKHPLLKNKEEKTVKSPEKNTFNCRKCNKRFKTALECLKHHNEKHQIEHPLLKNKEEQTVKSPAKNTFNCKKCNKSFKTAILCLDHHNKKHMEELKISKFNCDKCSSVYTNAGAYLEHYEKKHKPKDKKPVEKTDRLCDKCGAFPKNLSAHALLHTEPCTCKICEKKFTNKHNLIIHMYSHSDTGEKKEKESITAHINKEHKKLKSIQCNQCGRTFSTKFGLRNHKWRCGNLDQDLIKEKFPCNYCEKVFLSRGLLNLHLRCHNHEKLRKYKCDICDLSYIKKCALMRHQKIHFDFKQYKCYICYQRKFKTEYELQEHIRVHNDKMKKHECGQCGKKFARVFMLENHTQTEHNSPKVDVLHVNIDF